VAEMEILMRYREFSTHPHAGTKSRSRTAHLLVHDNEWDEMQRLCREHAAIDVVRVEPVPYGSLHNVEVLCWSSDAASDLARAWTTRLI
jgi:hypothetical protein